ncbi:uncharacterized protein LOC111078288 isoform X2 [Drosophila obscura]|nr:uncharacterized protein LOC111078288 isoform X2 [Drosophila obscura]
MCFTYMAHDQPDPPPHAPLRALIADCEAKDIGLIVGCVATTHHSQWGSTDINERENLDDLDVLTPAHLLLGGPHETILEPDLTKLKYNRLDGWQRVTQLQQTFCVKPLRQRCRLGEGRESSSNALATG